MSVAIGDLMHPKYLVTSEPRENICPVVETIRIIGKKWYLIILHQLTKESMGFNDLKRSVRGISAKVLSESLSDLTSKGLIHRAVHSKSPIRVTYSLTEKGRELEQLFHDMKAWGEKWAICETPAAEGPAVEATGGAANGNDGDVTPA